MNPNPGGELPSDLIPPNAKIVYAPPGTPLPSRPYQCAQPNFSSTSIIPDRLKSEVTLARGQPGLDLLDGFLAQRIGRAAGARSPRFSGGVFRRGLGVRVNINWQSGKLNKFTPTDGVG